MPVWSHRGGNLALFSQPLRSANADIWIASFGERRFDDELTLILRRFLSAVLRLAVVHSRQAIVPGIDCRTA